jgi:hypothetical protein
MRHTHTHTHSLSLSDDDDDDDIINLNKTLLVLMSFVALVVGTTATSPNIGALRQEFVDQQGLDIVGHILAQTTEDGEIKQCCLSILRSIGEQGWLVDSRWLQTLRKELTSLASSTDAYAPGIARVGGVRLAVEATKSMHVDTVIHATACLSNITFPGAADSSMCQPLWPVERLYLLVDSALSLCVCVCVSDACHVQTEFVTCLYARMASMRWSRHCATTRKMHK